MNPSDAIVRAIVHLNFNEPDQALDVLVRALSEINFTQIRKDDSHNGNTAAHSA